MSELNDAIDFVRSSIDGAPQMPAGIDVKCSPHSDGGILVTLAKNGKTHSFHVTSDEASMHDSDAFILRIVFNRLKPSIDAVNGAAPKKAKKRGKKSA